MSNQGDLPASDSSVFYFTEGISRVCDVVPTEEFVIRVNGQDSLLSLVEAVFLSPRVFSAWKTDSTIRFFEINDPEIDGSHIGDLLEILDGRRVTVTASSRLSLLRLSSQLGNRDLTKLFFGLGSGETVIEAIHPSLGFDLTVERREDLMVLEVDTLDEFLRSEELVIESEDWLLDLILDLGDNYRSLLNAVKYEFVSEEGLSKFLSHFDYCDITDEIWKSLMRRLLGEKSKALSLSRYSSTHGQFDSVIVRRIPGVLSVIEETNVRLLYRGSRDGFSAADHDPRVKGHSNLLTLVETTEGWTFGSYTHCKWPDSGWAMDPTAKSFLFTLTNPHKIPPRRFEMTSDQQKHTSYLWVGRQYMVWIGFQGAIALSSDCNQNSESHCRGFAASNTMLTFENDSGVDGKTLFTGSETFTVKELEIFEFFQ
jgi:hypothetical protein